MTPADTLHRSPRIGTDVTPSEVEQVERALIDASTRVPVLMFYTSAIIIGCFWGRFWPGLFRSSCTPLISFRELVASPGDASGRRT